MERRRSTLVHREYVIDDSDGAWVEGKAGGGQSPAEVFFLGSKPRIVILYLASESGDWSLTAKYYFRADGSLAKQLETLNTFYGNARVERSKVVDCRGKTISSQSDHRDLQTRLPKKAATDFIDEVAPSFPTTSKLPLPRQ